MKSNDLNSITGAQLRAARALLNISAQELANLASVGVATIRRAEANNSSSSMSAVVKNAIISALERAGVELIAENGGGAGVRLTKAADDKP